MLHFYAKWIHPEDDSYFSLSFQSSFACAVFSLLQIGRMALGKPRDWIKSGHVMWCAKFDFLRAAGPPSLCQTPTTVPSCTHNSSSKRLLATFLWLQNHNDLASEVKRGSQAHVETFLGRWMDVTHDQGDSLENWSRNLLGQIWEISARHKCIALIVTFPFRHLLSCSQVKKVTLHRSERRSKSDR